MFLENYSGLYPSACVPIKVQKHNKMSAKSPKGVIKGKMLSITIGFTLRDGRR